MAHPHSVVSFPLLPGSPTGQSMRTIPFPNLGFPECSNELQLDLNFVQRLSQGSLAVQNEVERGDPSLLHQRMELDGSSGPHQEYVLKPVPDLAMSTCAMDASETPQSHDHWITHVDAVSADVVADTSVVTGANTLLDAAADEPTNGAAAITSIVAVQNEMHIKDEAPSLGDNQAALTCTTRKRKNIIRHIPVPLKFIAPVEKKRPSQGTNVNAVTKAPIKDPQHKCRPVESTGHKLLLEERKLDLAERRLALEEKKTEVTIEIGRGLVSSMERMTTAISALGVFAGPPR